MNSLKDKVALVTGAARGLGRAIAERYAALGADIVINYSKDKVSADDAVSCIRAMGVRVIAIQADISKPTEIERLFWEAVTEFGKIDIVVANA
ncbi:MAG: SDR family NAD(P)-dependent oxidoreductase, partial [Pedobacter sp.]